MILRRRKRSATCLTGGTGKHSNIITLEVLLPLSRSQVFPSYVTRERGITKQSALAKLKEKRARMKQMQNTGPSSTS